VLTDLTIREFALIEELRVEFGPGFTCITGETGAGKSIIIDALSAAVGDRIAADSVRTGSESALIEATFDASDTPKALAAAAEAGVEADADGILILTRTVGAAGRHRCRVNGRAVPLSVLRGIGDRLVDIHGQHEHQALIREESHLQFLDEFAGVEHLARRAEYARLYRTLMEVRSDRDALAQAARERIQQADLLRFQVGEIDSAGLSPGDEKTLLTTRARLANAERLREGAQLTHGLLAGEPAEGLAARDAVREVLRLLQELSAFDPTLGEPAAALEVAAYQLDDVAAALSRYVESVEADPAGLDEVEQRLALIGRLKRKYGDTVEEILGFAEEARGRLGDLEGADERIAELGVEAERLAAEAGRLAVGLSSARQEAAARLSAALSREIAEVGMRHGRLHVDLERRPAADGLPDGEGSSWAADPRGTDQCRFLFSANPGEPLKPLAAVASGGELSRVMLVLKSLCSRGHEIPTVVFDEIDAGIGGHATHAVGRKLARVSRRAQVLCVTHLPQIARLADHHLRADKRTVGGRAHVEVRALPDDERVAELARMLGAREGDRAALEHAAELLEAGVSERTGARGAGAG
jgi:DNA repair protein RecN (Recombination protein N)